MFGYDDATLERIRTGRRTRRWVVAIELLVATPILAYTALLWLWTTPGTVQRVIDHIIGDAPVSVQFATVDLLPHGQRWDPSTWELLFTGVQIRFDDPTRPDVDVDKVVLGVPDLGRAWSGSEVVLRRMIVVGLDIRAKQQRAPRDWEPGDSALALVRAERVEVWDAHFWAPYDTPLPETEVTRIFGTLTDLSFTPGDRALSGSAVLRADQFRTGTLTLDRLSFTEIAAENSNLTLKGGRYAYAGGRGTLTGTVRGIHRRATVDLRLQLTDAVAETLITASTGKPSPLRGRVDADLEVHSGGSLPRGGAWYEGQIVFQDGRLRLGRELTPFQRDLFALAPWVELDEQDQLIIGEVAGRARFTRAGVTLHELNYTAGRRDLALWGTLTPEAVALTLRALPQKKAEVRAGWGVVIEGQPNALTVRVATREELLKTSEGEAPTDAGKLRAAIRAAVASTGLDRSFQLRVPEKLRRKKRAGDDAPETPPEVPETPDASPAPEAVPEAVPVPETPLDPDAPVEGAEPVDPRKRRLNLPGGR